MAEFKSSENFDEIISVLEDLKRVGIIEKYAIGGAFAAILHYEPISTIDLDIFFFLAEKSASPILSLNAIYDYAKERGFSFDHELLTFTAGSCSLSKPATACFGRKQLKPPTG